MKKATIRIQGGLGNQLHCYAFGRAIASQNNAILEVDIYTAFENDPYTRQYLLYLFPNLTANVKKKINSRLLKLWIKIFARISKIFPIYLRPIAVEERPVRYQKDVHYATYMVDTYFIGGWSSYKYYQDISCQLKLELNPPVPDDQFSLKILDRINSVRSCSIHWRSYNEEKLFQYEMCDYYARSVSFFEKKYPDIVFFIFSDSPLGARKNLKNLGKNMVFIDSPYSKGNIQSLNDFYLMYSCEHAIIADSSFSWWASWLSDSTDKITVAPYGLSPLGKNWVPENWKLF
jgi:hypothetical protein